MIGYRTEWPALGTISWGWEGDKPSYVEPCPAVAINTAKPVGRDVPQLLEVETSGKINNNGDTSYYFAEKVRVIKIYSPREWLEICDFDKLNTRGWSNLALMDVNIVTHSECKITTDCAEELIKREPELEPLINIRVYE